MNRTIRLLHFADAHVGMENYGRIDPATGTSSRVRDFLDRVDEVIDHALAHEADLAVFAGDAFKSRDPDPTQQRELAQRFKRLADAMPLLLLVGNHDMPGMSARATSLDIFQALRVPGVIVGLKPGGQVVETRSGPVFLAWVPYPMRNRLLAREEHQGKSIEELEQALRQAVSDILADLAAQAAELPMPRVLAGHFSVAEAKLGSERTVMLGRDVAVFRSVLCDPAWDYVALGHIHRHQDLNPGSSPSVVYSGSLERIDFGEESEEKGFCWVELARGETHWSFVPVRARPFVTLRLDARQAADPAQAVLSALGSRSLEGAVVRLLVELREDQRLALNEKDILQAAQGASSVTLHQQIESQARGRLGVLEPHSLSPAELVERYFTAKGEDPERLHQLLAQAEELLRDPD
ncbi:MAG: exonuclease SbcCD subunit D [Anaerolineales bacterium]|nr:exonuclease SbcCD subunit D [Anaerolineales bacterium]